MIVSKFGGTSVGDAAAIRRAVAVIHARRPERPVVVVSALAGVTDLLLGLERQSDPAARLAEIGDRHRRVADELGLPPADFERIAADLATLTRWLHAPRRTGWTAAERDRVVGHGELWSSRLVVGALRARGVAADWVDARHFMITDDRFTEATPDRVELARRSARFLGPLVASGRVPVTQGFIGATDDGRPTTLGRGGSDYSASLIAAALGAWRVEIWTDVDGIMTADPRIVPDAQVLAETSYEEAADLARFGAKVIHPATHAPLVDAAIPCLVRNSFAPELPGTRIVADPIDDDGEPRVRSVALRSGITIANLRAERRPAADFLRGLVAVFARHEVHPDVLASSERAVSVSIDQRACSAGLLADLARLGPMSRRDGRAMIALVGVGLRSIRGLAARLFAAIGDIDVEIISHGASDTTVTVIVREEHGPEAVRRLHAEFFGSAVEGALAPEAVYLAT